MGFILAGVVILISVTNWQKVFKWCKKEWRREQQYRKALDRIETLKKLEVLHKKR